MAKVKELSSPYSSGGGGHHFEALVQASFVTLMLTGGYPPGPFRRTIAQIEFQNKNRDFDMDDFLVTYKNTDEAESPKLICEVKTSIQFNKSCAPFGDVMNASWSDFNKPLFAKDKDAFALITGPLSADDQKSMQFLLYESRHTKKCW